MKLVLNIQLFASKRVSVLQRTAVILNRKDWELRKRTDSLRQRVQSYTVSAAQRFIRV